MMVLSLTYEQLHDGQSTKVGRKAEGGILVQRGFIVAPHFCCDGGVSAVKARTPWSFL